MTYKNEINGLELICYILLLIFLFITLYSLLGDISFRFRYSHPKVSGITETKLDPTKEPMQIEVDEKNFRKIQGEKNLHAAKIMAKYSITGMVVAKNQNFWFRGVMRNEFDDVALIDYGIVWGDLVDKNLIKEHFTFKSKKTLGEARQLSYHWTNIPQSSSYVGTHVAHTHIIPANDNVMGALLKVKKYDIVRLDGYLVDLYNPRTSQRYAMTSLSRSDTNATSRGHNQGGGACEVMYVARVQIENKIYK